MTRTSVAGTGAGQKAPRWSWPTPKTWATALKTLTKDQISKTIKRSTIPGQENDQIVMRVLKETAAAQIPRMTITDQIDITTPQTLIANKNQGIN